MRKTKQEQATVKGGEKRKGKGVCDLDIQPGPGGKLYLSCNGASCTGKCKLYIIRNENNTIKEIGCDCV